MGEFLTTNYYIFFITTSYYKLYRSLYGFPEPRSTHPSKVVQCRLLSWRRHGLNTATAAASSTRLRTTAGLRSGVGSSRHLQKLNSRTCGNITPGPATVHTPNGLSGDLKVQKQIAHLYPNKDASRIVWLMGAKYEMLNATCVI